jgi:hypothetical protein
MVTVRSEIGPYRLAEPRGLDPAARPDHHQNHSAQNRRDAEEHK